jgi:hypothetical protein
MRMEAQRATSRVATWFTTAVPVGHANILEKGGASSLTQALYSELPACLAACTLLGRRGIL